MATWGAKRPNWKVLADRVGDKSHKIKENGITSGRDDIGDVGRGTWPTQYREERNLLGAVEEKNAVTGLRNRYHRGIHDSSLPINTWNRERDKLIHAPS